MHILRDGHILPHKDEVVPGAPEWYTQGLRINLHDDDEITPQLPQPLARFLHDRLNVQNASHGSESWLELLQRLQPLGERLGCGAHISGLRRTQAGAFLEPQCVTVETLKQIKEAEGLVGLDRILVPMDRAVEQLPAVRLPRIAADSVQHGQSVLVRHLPAEGLVRLYEEEQFIGIGVIDDDGKVAPRRLVTTH